MKKLFATLCIASTAALFACSQKPVEKAGATTNIDAKKLFEEGCSACHPSAKATNYTGGDWKGVVDRMITTHGAKITPENAVTIVDYLNKTYPKK
jgi:cytochrome c2